MGLKVISRWTIFLFCLAIAATGVAQTEIEAVGDLELDENVRGEWVDGLNFAAELLLVSSWSHPELTPAILTEEQTVASTPFFGVEFKGRECPAHDDMLVSAEFIEVDQTIGSTILVTVGVAVAGAALAGVEIGSLGAATPWVIAGGLATIEIAYALNGDDDLGKMPPRKVPPPDVIINLVGKGGGSRWALGDYSHPATPPDSLNCGGAPPAHAALSPSDARTAVFTPLQEAQTMVASVAREAGTYGFDNHGLAESRNAYEGLVVGSGHMLAAATVHAAIGFEGSSTALDHLVAGEVALESQNSATAMAFFADAFESALTAIAEDSPAQAPPIFDPRTLLLPSFAAVRPGTTFDVSGWAIGLGPTETIDQVNVYNHEDLIEGSWFPGQERTAVVLGSTLSEELPVDVLVGLGRFSAAVVDPPDTGCATDHLVDGTEFGTGVFIDGEGPYFDPDPTGCGFGPVATTTLEVDQAGVPFDVDLTTGLFTVPLEVSSEIEPGRYDLQVGVSIYASGVFNREEIVNLPVVVLQVYPEDTIFASGLESGDTGDW